MFPSRRHRIARSRVARTLVGSRAVIPSFPFASRASSRVVDARAVRFAFASFFAFARVTATLLSSRASPASSSPRVARLGAGARGDGRSTSRGVGGDIARFPRPRASRRADARADVSGRAMAPKGHVARRKFNSGFAPVNTTLRASSAFMYTFGTRRDRGFAPVNTTLRASSACRDLVSLSSEGVTHGYRRPRDATARRPTHRDARRARRRPRDRADRERTRALTPRRRDANRKRARRRPTREKTDGNCVSGAPGRRR